MNPSRCFATVRVAGCHPVGARLIVQRHARHAANSCAALAKKRIHPHVLRHSTAVHLLKAQWI